MDRQETTTEELPYYLFKEINGEPIDMDIAFPKY